MVLHMDPVDGDSDWLRIWGGGLGMGLCLATIATIEPLHHVCPHVIHRRGALVVVKGLTDRLSRC